MGQSLSANYQHMVFCTKKKQPFIVKSIRPTLNAYIGGILRSLDCAPIQINCVEDHIHIFFRQSKLLGIAKIAEEIKKNSSKWIKQFPEISSDFKWQTGYGSFSVSGSGVENVSRYIKNQEEIHRKRKLKREIEKMMKDNKLTEYNEQYFWD